MRALFLSLVVSLGLIAGVISSSLVGCGAAETAFDCHQVCERYQSCFDNGYDVSGCESRCRTQAANDSTVRTAADECEACIGDKSCVSSIVQCTTCGRVVP